MRPGRHEADPDNARLEVRAPRRASAATRTSRRASRSASSPYPARCPRFPPPSNSSSSAPPATSPTASCCRRSTTCTAKATCPRASTSWAWTGARWTTTRSRPLRATPPRRSAASFPGQIDGGDWTAYTERLAYVQGDVTQPETFERLRCAPGRAGRGGRLRRAAARARVLLLGRAVPGRADRHRAGGGGPARRRRARPARRRKAVRARPGDGARPGRPADGAPPRSRRSTASTTTWAKRPSRTCWRSGSRTRCSSPSGTAATSTTCRSPSPRRSAWSTAAATTRPLVRCATWSRTTLCNCSALSRWSRRSTFNADEVRSKKVDVLHAVRPITQARVSEVAVRGQYGPGYVCGERVPGYRQEPNVDPKSATDTYAAIKVEIDNWRWQGVPFYLRTGKRLPRRVSEVSVEFRAVPHRAFPAAVEEAFRPNRLVLRIQPDEGVALRFQAKRPGPNMLLHPVSMRFDYDETYGEGPPDAYETLLLDAIRGDATLFMRQDQVESAWAVVQPVLDAWEATPPAELPNYAAGTWGPAAADRLLAADGRAWTEPMPPDPAYAAARRERGDQGRRHGRRAADAGRRLTRMRASVYPDSHLTECFPHRSRPAPPSSAASPVPRRSRWTTPSSAARPEARGWTGCAPRRTGGTARSATRSRPASPSTRRGIWEWLTSGQDRPHADGARPHRGAHPVRLRGAAGPAPDMARPLDDARRDRGPALSDRSRSSARPPRQARLWRRAVFRAAAAAGRTSRPRRRRALARPLRPPRHGHGQAPGRPRAARGSRRWASARTWRGGACDEARITRTGLVGRNRRKRHPARLHTRAPLFGPLAWRTATARSGPAGPFWATRTASTRPATAPSARTSPTSVRASVRSTPRSSRSARTTRAGPTCTWGPSRRFVPTPRRAAGCSIPVHWATFNLAFHGWTEPAERVLVAAEAAGVPIAIPRPGESVVVSDPPPARAVVAGAGVAERFGGADRVVRRVAQNAADLSRFALRRPAFPGLVGTPCMVSGHHAWCPYCRTEAVLPDVVYACAPRCRTEARIVPVSVRRSGRDCSRAPGRARRLRRWAPS